MKTEKETKESVAEVELEKEIVNTIEKRERDKISNIIEKWSPKTKLGEEVKNGKVANIDMIL